MSNNKTERKTCEKCRKSKSVRNFYTTSSSKYKDGYSPFCKACVNWSVDPKDLDSVKNMLMILDRPFIIDVWKKSKEKESAFGQYLKAISSLMRYKSLTFKDSDVTLDEEVESIEDNPINVELMEELETENGKIEMSKDLIIKYGAGYSNREYLEMEKFYQDMEISHDINTPQLKKQLKLLCQIQILMDRALQEGDHTAFKNYNDRYEKILDSSGFKPKDRKSSDESVGIRNFSTIFEEVEKRGYVEPKPVEEKMDIVDVAILSILNYTRQLVGHGKMDKLPNEVRESLHGEELLREEKLTKNGDLDE
jgi:hypothetical protein